MRMKKTVWGFFGVPFLLMAVAGHTVDVADSRIPGITVERQEASDSVAGSSILNTAAKEQETSDPAADISLYATAAVLIDADSGRVLYGKNENTPMAMASTTKIMTCIQVLEHASLDDVLTVSSYAASMPQVKLSIRKGEEYTVRDLLYSLMLESHNDSAVALAEHVGRQFLPPELKSKPVSEYTAEESRKAVAEFTGLMNGKAAELGCVDTWFITPNGLDEVEEIILQDGQIVQKEHSTTAAELARIMAYCIIESPMREDFLAVTRTSNYSFYANGRSFSCVNHNAFLTMMDGALSGKTGFTNKAGYCYVGALKRDDRTFVVALLACGWPNNKTYKWSDTRELMQYGIDNFFYRSFTEEGVIFDGSLLQPIPVEEGRTEVLGETAYVEITIAGRDDSDTEWNDMRSNRELLDAERLLMRADEQIQVDYIVEEMLRAPVESGTRVGTVEYSVGGVVYREEAIVTADTVEKIDFRWCIQGVFDRFLL